MSTPNFVTELVQRQANMDKVVDLLVEHPKVLLAAAILVCMLIVFGLVKGFKHLVQKWDTDDPSAPRF